MTTTMVINGLPLSEAGLDQAYFVWDDGRREKLEGLVVPGGTTILEAFAAEARKRGAVAVIEGRMLALQAKVSA